MALALILVAGNKGAFPGLVCLSLPYIPSCRIEIDEDEWLCKLAVNYLLTLWFNEGRESVISGDRRFSLAHKLGRWAIRCRRLFGLVRGSSSRPLRVVWGRPCRPTSRRVRLAKLHTPAPQWKNPVYKQPFHKWRSRMLQKLVQLFLKECNSLPPFSKYTAGIFNDYSEY